MRWPGGYGKAHYDRSIGDDPKLRLSRCGSKKHSADAEKSYQKRRLLLSEVSNSSEISNWEVLCDGALLLVGESVDEEGLLANSIATVGLREDLLAFAVDYGRVTRKPEIIGFG